MNCPRIPTIFDVHNAVKTFLSSIYVERKENKIPTQNYSLAMFYIISFW